MDRKMVLGFFLGLTVLACAAVYRDAAMFQGAQPVGTGLESNPVIGGAQAPDGSVVAAQATAGGVVKNTHDAMCFSSACAEVAFSAIGLVASTATLAVNTWHEVTVTADGSGGQVACWSTTAIPPYVCGANDAGCVLDAGASCFGKPKLKEGIKPFAVGPTGDAGTIAINVFATAATATTITLCPEVPCR